MRKSRITGISRVIYVLFTLGLCFSFASELSAKPDSFQSLVKTASKAYADANYDLALEKFREAYAIKPMTALLYNMGRASESKADFPSAIGFYTQFVSSPDVEHEARTEALERINTLNEVLRLNGQKAAPPSTGVALAARPSTELSAEKPKKGSTKAADKAVAAPSGACIDINSASLEQINELVGIGDKKAKDIMDSRQSQGPFASFSDITRVKGIGEKTVAKFSSQLCPIAGGSAAATTTPKPEANTQEAPAGKKSKAAPKTSEKKATKVLPKSDSANNWDI